MYNLIINRCDIQNLSFFRTICSKRIELSLIAGFSRKMNLLDLLILIFIRYFLKKIKFL
jgi:hypothetical protein